MREWCRVTRTGGKVVVIEGKWQERSAAERLKRFVGRICVGIYERRNPWNGYSNNLSKALPLYGGADPERIVEIFEDAGLSDVAVTDLSWIRERMVEDKPFFYRFVLGRAYFMVEGRKEVIL